MSTRVLTIAGTRPELIRLSRIIPKLDSFAEHRFVYTGQNFDPKLKDIFFEDLGLRRPDVEWNASGSFGRQAQVILDGTEELIRDFRPDRVLILGDTTSGLAAVSAKRLGVPVYHMEAGNRCYDDRVPEEINRRIIDHSSEILLPYTERSRANLLEEGIPARKIFVTGNPIFEVLQFYRPQIECSEVISSLGVERLGYVLVTLHRAENVDDPSRLKKFTELLAWITDTTGKAVLWSVHPRTRERLKSLASAIHLKKLTLLEPLGFFDFVNLEQNAHCVLSDSGTVQEECAIFGTPTVTLRDSTERPETLESGRNAIVGNDLSLASTMIKVAVENRLAGSAPPEYQVPDVSNTVLRLLLSSRIL